MSFNIEEKYNSIIDDLKSGRRGLQKFTETELRFLFEQLAFVFQNSDEGAIQKILCILDHSYSTHEMFEGILCRIMKEKGFTVETKVYALSTSQRFVIQRRNLLGEKVPDYYLDTLELMIKSKNWELYEWTLRTVDELGLQGKKLVNTILKNRPRFFGLFNKHGKASHEIIEMLLMKWGFKVNE